MEAPACLEHKKEEMKKYSFFLKLALLCIIFYWIFKSVNIKATINVLEKTNVIYFFIAFLLSNISNIFLTIKWKRLAAPLKIKSNFFDLLKLNYVSIFYSSFLPGQSSGELIKGLRLTKKESSAQKVWIPIFIDKITNLLIVLIIGFIAILSDKTFRTNKTLVFIVSLLTVMFSLITIILFSDNTRHFIDFLRDQLIKSLKFFKFKTDQLESFSLSYLGNYKKHRLLMLETLIWSVLIKLPHVFAFYFLALSLNLSLSVIQCAWLFSIVSLVTLIPISFSGLGVRESTLIVILSNLGIERFNSLSLSILIFFTGILVAIIGGVCELFSGNKKSNEKTN